MFTGLIEEQGKINSLEREGTNLNIEIQGSIVLDALKLGDSIAVDGCCQTVTKITENSFWVTAIDETLKLTNFNSFVEGTSVNLERCLRAEDRLGGHIVQGHVDGIGVIKDIVDVNGSWEFSIEVPMTLNKYIIHKGSIAVSGISLTVAAIEESRNTALVRVCIIPKTLEVTTLGKLKSGDQVNIEVDCLAKYMEKLAVSYATN